MFSGRLSGTSRSRHVAVILDASIGGWIREGLLCNLSGTRIEVQAGSGANHKVPRQPVSTPQARAMLLLSLNTVLLGTPFTPPCTISEASSDPAPGIFRHQFTIFRL